MVQAEWNPTARVWHRLIRPVCQPATTIRLTSLEAPGVLVTNPATFGRPPRQS